MVGLQVLQQPLQYLCPDQFWGRRGREEVRKEERRQEGFHGSKEEGGGWKNEENNGYLEMEGQTHANFVPDDHRCLFDQFSALAPKFNHFGEE